jgi:hypothetical protein
MLRALTGLRHRGRPRLIEQVLADQDADQLPDVPLLGVCPVAEQVECSAAEIGPLACLLGGMAELEVVLMNCPPFVGLAADGNRLCSSAAVEQQVHQLVAEPVSLEARRMLGQPLARPLLGVVVPPGGAQVRRSAVGTFSYHALSWRHDRTEAVDLSPS